MKTHSAYRTGFAALALLFILAACNDLTGAGTGSGETIPEGMGLARIRLATGGPAGGIVPSIRTAVPDISAYYFTLDFTAPGKTAVSMPLDPPGTILSVALEPAIWTLVVTGYAESARTTLKVTGNVTVPITAGTSKNFDVSLSPGFSSGGTGNLGYTISFPGTVSRAWLGLYPIDNTPGTSEEVIISDGVTGSFPGISEGSYRAVIDLYDGTNNKALIWTEVAHIYDGATTTLTHNFATTPFADCPPLITAPGATLGDKLDAALNSESGSYTIALNGSEDDLASFAPKTLNVTGNKNISITIRGNGEIVAVNQTGTPLLTLVPTSGSLSLTLQDVTLQGRSGNSVPVVRVYDRGTLLMKTGSLITGNTSSTGGGVYVYDGTFTMNGGAISSNSSTSYGGGVYIGSGTFSMSGGAISGNDANSGGGVYVSDGTITMSGGAISGNTFGTGAGGGIYLASSTNVIRTFTMSGGAISGNSSTLGGSGSGVYVSDMAFTMNGGTISGNTTTGGGGGGGVYVSDHYGVFTMNGGNIIGNTVTITTSSGGGGGGVYVNDGTFTMNGGAVNGNTLSGTNTYGKEVLVRGGSFRISGDAWPERVFLYNNTRSITISGPLSNGLVPIDLGITSSAPLANWENAPVLSYYGEGDLASLKTHFTLGNSKMTASPWGAETAISATDYEINDEGLFVHK
jgi:hypothetical protein